MTDMRTKKLHMIFDMADREFTVFVASPYNLFIDPYRPMVETALSYFGLTELAEHKRFATSDEVNKHFPHVEVGPLYILKATLDRLPPGGIGQLLGEIAQQTGLPNYNLKVWSDDVTDEEPKKSGEALLSHGMGEHPDEKILTADQAASLHGSKRIAAVMAELARTDEEKYGQYAAGVTFAASSSALKEMFNKPFRKGVYECKAVGGEVIVGAKLAEATDGEYLTTKASIEKLIENTKHRSVLEAVDYVAENDEAIRRRVIAGATKFDLPIKDIEVSGQQVALHLSVAWISFNDVRKLLQSFNAREAQIGKVTPEGSLSVMFDIA